MTLLHQSLSIIFAFLLVIIWQLLGLQELTIPLIGILVFGYLLFSRRQKPSNTSASKEIDHLTTGILTTLVLLIIIETGGLTSILFFLLYFIPFALCFMLVPESALVFLAGIVILFLPMAMSGNVTENLIKVGSVILITPLAYFFGKEFHLVSEHQQQDEMIATKISNEAANVLKDQAPNLSETDKAQLADIIQESEELKQ